MTSNTDTKNGKVLGGVLSAAIVIGAVALGLMVLYHVNSYPRTDDAEILANFIGIAPQVEGPILRLNVRDNQLVKQGDLLYEIDDRPFRYALENAVSEQAALEGTDLGRAAKNRGAGERGFGFPGEYSRHRSRRDPVINMQKFARETSLSVARDRVAGVFLGLLMMWLIFDQLWGAPASVEMKRVFISTLRLLAQFAREPVSADIRSAIRRTSALHDTINTKFDNVRSLADGVLLEFGPSRRHDLALRDRIRRWQPQLRALFIMRGASLKYRLQLPGFVLPEAVIASLQAYDECSAQMLENIADRMEGKTSQGRPVSADSFALLEQIAGIVSHGRIATIALRARRNIRPFASSD